MAVNSRHNIYTSIPDWFSQSNSKTATPTSQLTVKQVIYTGGQSVPTSSGISEINLFNKFVIVETQLDITILTNINTAIVAIDTNEEKVGELVTAEGWATSDYLAIAAGTLLHITATAHNNYGVVFYDNTQTVIQGNTVDPLGSELTVPANARYFRVCSTADDETFSLIYNTSKSYSKEQLLVSDSNVLDYTQLNPSIPEGIESINFNNNALKLLVQKPLQLNKDVNNVIKLSLDAEATGIGGAFWEIKVDENTKLEYIFTKYPVATQYGITMYTDEGNLVLPDIYAGLPHDNTIVRKADGTFSIPIDNSTIVINNGKLTALGGATGGTASEVAWSNIKGKPSWLKDDVIKFDEVVGLSDKLDEYVTLKLDEDIEGVKDFLNGIEIDGIPISKYKDDVLYINSNLVVRGGITMYGTDGTTAPSIWNDAPIATTSNTPNGKGIASFDSKFFSVTNGHVTFIGSTGGGGVTDYNDLTNKPDLTIYALKTSLSSYATKSTTLSGYGISDAYTKTESDNKYLLKSSYTASDVLTKLKTVDGSSSGLDADKLDGQEGSYYAPASSLANYLPLSGGTLTDELTGTTIIAHDLYWSEYKNSSLGSAGWYRFATSTRPNSRGNTYILSICRVYNNASNESYLIAVTLDYSGCSFTQLAGHRYSAAVQLVTKIRCTRTNSRDVYFDFYYTGSSQNTVYVNAVGHCKVQTPEATSSTLTYTDEFILEEGVKSSLGFIGDLKGNADTATKLKTPRSIWGNNFDGFADIKNSSLILYKNESSYTGGWSREVESKDSSGKVIGAFGLYGVGDTFGRAYIGESYENMWLSVTPTYTRVYGKLETYQNVEVGTTLSINGITLKKSASGVLYVDGNLVVKGGVTMYGTDTTSSPSVIDSLPIANASGTKGIATFDATYFKVTDGKVTLVDDLALDEYVTSLSTKGNYLTYTKNGVVNNVTVPYATTASKLSAARTISLTGHAIGSGSFDGFTNLGINVTIPTRNVCINGVPYTVHSTITTDTTGIYAPTNGGTNGYVLKANGATSVPTWIALDSLSVGYATRPYINNSLSNGTFPIIFTNTARCGTPGYDSLYVDTASGSGYNPSTNTFYATTFNGALSGNATSASRLTTISKTAWGKTYWTSGGVPTDIDGDMSMVGSITPSIHNTYSIGSYGNGFAWSNFNCISSGAISNNLWLCGGTTNGIGVVIARSNSNTATGELCRFTEQGMVWASGVIPAIVSTAQEIHLKYNNADATSIVFNGASFKPFISASDNIMLGLYNSLWKGLFLSTDASVPRTEKGVTFCSSNGYAEGKIGANSSGIGIYTVGGLYLRSGCTKGANGTMTESSTGAVIDASGNMLVTGGVTMYSDLRKKTILNHVELSLKEVADAPLIEHYYNSDESKRTHVGSVAQYWAGLNNWFCKEDEEGFLTMEIQNAALASAISVARELSRYESETDKRIRLLEKENQILKNEIENLRKNK